MDRTTRISKTQIILFYETRYINTCNINIKFPRNEIYTGYPILILSRQISQRKKLRKMSKVISSQSFNRSKINKISEIKILRSIYTCLIMTESFHLMELFSTCLIMFNLFYLLIWMIYTNHDLFIRFLWLYLFY